jgi:uncharacterized Zn finger protein
MRIQVFSEYYNLAQEGRVKPLSCPKHKDDEPVIFPLVHAEQDEKIVLHCLACGYFQTAGLQLYENILSQITEAKK